MSEVFRRGTERPPTPRKAQTRSRVLWPIDGGLTTSTLRATWAQTGCVNAADKTMGLFEYISSYFISSFGLCEPDDAETMLEESNAKHIKYKKIIEIHLSYDSPWLGHAGTMFKFPNSTEADHFSTFFS